MTNDTIAAIATPPGMGAIAVLRLTGPNAFPIADAIFRTRQSPTPRMQLFGKVVDAEGRPIDEVLLTQFPGPASYTGEDVVEISCHGGMLVTRTVLDRILEAGARHAEGGEFTQRAFSNGKMDLTQAEAVMDVISAQTELALRAANEQLTGRLGKRTEELRQLLIGIIAHLEAFIDFPDEDIDPETGQQFTNRVEAIAEEVHRLSSTADQGRILREGVRTVIAGSPNVGKSSLLNVLLGFERAIVSDVAGTTRDTIEEVINLRGIPLRLIDTAGVRASDDEIEREGISRTEAQVANAELVLEVFDASEAKPEGLTVPESARHVIVLNKSDLQVHSDWEGLDGAVQISCTDETGIENLTDQVIASLQGAGAAWGEQSVAVNARHKACLQSAAGFLSAAIGSLEQNDSPEITAIELRSALDAIGEIVGKTDVEEILDEIFGTFCIGK